MFRLASNAGPSTHFRNAENRRQRNQGLKIVSKINLQRCCCWMIDKLWDETVLAKLCENLKVSPIFSSILGPGFIWQNYYFVYWHLDNLSCACIASRIAEGGLKTCPPTGGDQAHHHHHHPHRCHHHQDWRTDTILIFCHVFSPDARWRQCFAKRLTWMEVWVIEGDGRKWKCFQTNFKTQRAFQYKYTSDRS